MRILVTGSRDWREPLVVYREIIDAMESTDPPTSTRDVVIVHGACPTGADDMADAYAVANFIAVERHPADWERYGRRAGFVRNKTMVDLGADICLAFIRNNSRGASMTADLAEKAGIPTRRIIR